jgi:hypothetical protein
MARSLLREELIVPAGFNRHSEDALAAEKCWGPEEDVVLKVRMRRGVGRPEGLRDDVLASPAPLAVVHEAECRKEVEYLGMRREDFHIQARGSCGSETVKDGFEEQFPVFDPRVVLRHLERADLDDGPFNPVLTVTFKLQECQGGILALFLNDEAAASGTLLAHHGEPSVELGIIGSQPVEDPVLWVEGVTRHGADSRRWCEFGWLKAGK